MHAHLAKELRPLLFPWAVAALAAAGHLVALANPVFKDGAFGSFLMGLAGAAFVIGVLVLAAMPIGVELQDRTLTLLLSQPAERLQVWKEKLLAATLAIVALGVIHGVAFTAVGHLPLFAVLGYLAFAFTAICSVGYYTLATRSILIGIATAVGTPYAIAGSVFLIVYSVLGFHIELSEQAGTAVLAVACVVYSAFFLRLSRRQFAELELRDGPVSRAAEIPAALVPRAITGAFRCRPDGLVANLVRKEVCLQKPMFLVSAVFTAGWLVTLALMVLRPAWHGELVGVFNGLTGTQIVLMVILTGCVALSEDKSLGTVAWHLTLPVSARRQWAIKLLVGAGTIIATAVVLPLLLAALTLFKARVGLLALRLHDAWGFVFPCTLLFVLSFWSASIVTNAVRAALTCMLTLMGLVACIMQGARVPEVFFISPQPYGQGLQSGPITQILARLQLPPDYFFAHVSLVQYGIWLVALVFIATMLIQSLAQFRRTRTGIVSKVKCVIVLAAIALGGSFWCADLMKSAERQEERFRGRLIIALTALPEEKATLQSGKPWMVTAQELEQTGKLSNAAKMWLRNARITVTPLLSPSKLQPCPLASSHAQVEVQFPNGTQYTWSW